MIPGKIARSVSKIHYASPLEGMEMIKHLFVKQVLGFSVIMWEFIEFMLFYLYFYLFQGVSCGLFVGWLLSAWIGMGAIVYPPDKRPLPVSEYKCPSFNGTEAEGRVPYHFKGY